VYEAMLKEGCMLLGPYYGGITGFSRSTSTTVRMDACSQLACQLLESQKAFQQNKNL